MACNVGVTRFSRFGIEDDAETLFSKCLYLYDREVRLLSQGVYLSGCGH